MKPVCLTIAGFDGSGGAGLQADLKTLMALGCYGTCTLTALPVQNTCGVQACYSLPPDAIQAQLKAVCDDIPPAAVKIGMLHQAAIIEVVAQFLQSLDGKIPVVLDPVLVAKSGDALLTPPALETLQTQLLPLATVVTPNLPEAQALAKQTTQDLNQLGKVLLSQGAQAVLIKGGHLQQHHCSDVLVRPDHPPLFLEAQRIDTRNDHGTGCTLSAALAAALAYGYSLPQACVIAKQYLWQALQAARNDHYGHGHGSVNHAYAIAPLINQLAEHYDD